MKRTVPVRWVIGLAILLAIWACSQSKPEAGGSSGPPPPSGPCSTPDTDCPCDTPGKVVDCGVVKIQSGDHVSCSMGKRKCEGTAWGECIGDHVTTKVIGGLKFKNLATSPSACANPCDPYCSNYVDDTDAMTPPPGFATDGGLSVVGSGGGGTIPASLQTTANGDSTCGAALNVHSDPCNASPLTSCQQDHRCDTATNTCVWNGGEGYFDPTAGGPDLTVGTACDIGWGNIVPVCNRGSTAIPAGSPINVYLTNPPSPPDGCAAIAGAPTCSQTVGTNGLPPGSCLNIVCSIPGDKFAVVNPGNPGAVAEGPGRCANNAAWAATSGTPGCATCQSCDTVVTGRVMDPGKNVGLNGVTVFQPNRAVAAIPDNAGGASPPPCDTCDSLLDPTSFGAGVNSELDGAFTLRRVAPGPGQKIVAQTGRWRRVATLDIPACQTTVLNDDQIRMPRNRSEGDIPKMALVEGSLEALECWLLKVGLDANEVWPRGGTAPGDSQPNRARVQLYRTNGMGQRSTCGGELGETCASGSCSDGRCNVAANTCASCGDSGEACCPFGSACSGSSRACDSNSNTCRSCGGSSEPCCATGTACDSGRTCDATNHCVRCGGSGEACCGSGTACESGLGCELTTNTCRSAGGDGQPCRTNGTCNSGVTCRNVTVNGVSGRVCGDGSPCGGAGQACCAGGTCRSPLTCGGAGVAGRCGKGGARGEVCRASGTPCDAPNTCGGGGVPNRCGTGCGGSGDKCCNGTTCAAGLTCGGAGVPGHCGTSSCGGVGQACCPGNACLNPLSCGANSPGVCGIAGGASCFVRPPAPPMNQLWDTNEINEFSAVILPCDGHLDATSTRAPFEPTTTQATKMLDYANAGGRVFMDHLTASAAWLNSRFAAPAWRSTNISTWQDSTSPANPAAGFIWGIGGTGTAAQRTFRDWIGMWAPFPGPSPAAGPGWLLVEEPRSDALVAGNQVMEFVRGRGNNNWPAPPYSVATGNTVSCNPDSDGDCRNSSYSYSLTFSFETSPTQAPSPSGNANTCGRVIYNGMHTNPSRATSAQTSSSDIFPRDCNLDFALSAEEKALEYQFFQLTACALGGAPPPPPPPPPPSLPATATFTRDYEAVCAPGSLVRWAFFSWQANVPAGTSIVFKAQTADAQADLAAEQKVGAGTATTTTATWTSDPNTVDWHLNNDIPGNPITSKRWLRIEMTFNTNGTVSPVLQNWRQAYDCIPVE